MNDIACLVTPDFFGVSLLSDSYFHPITSFGSLPLLSNAIVVGLIFFSYAGNHVTCCLIQNVVNCEQARQSNISNTFYGEDLIDI